MPDAALSHIRICDFGGQLAGAGATKILAAFGADVIRVEDPATEGRWDALRGVGPFVDDRRGVNLGGGFNNHNVGKRGVTINLRTEEGRELLADLVRISDVVCENFAAGVLEGRGFGYDALRAIREDVIYVSNSGFGATGPYRSFKTWGPIVQAVSGLTYTNGLPDSEPAGWGFSYMDHGAAFAMAFSVLAALDHRDRTGEGQWIDLASTSAGIGLLEPHVLDWTVNGRPTRRAGRPQGNRSDFDDMSPHGVYPSSGDDRWVAIACRDDEDWHRLVACIGSPLVDEARFATLEGRRRAADEIDEVISGWTRERGPLDAARTLVAAGVPASAVKSPEERIDGDPELGAWGLFPEVAHPEMGTVRVEGLPIHLSETDWVVEQPAPLLGEHNREVFTALLGRTEDDLVQLREVGAI